MTYNIYTVVYGAVIYTHFFHHNNPNNQTSEMKKLRFRGYVSKVNQL